MSYMNRKFKNGDIIKSPLFHEDPNKLFFAVVKATDLYYCALLPQDKIKKEMEGNIFIYSEEASLGAFDDYKELYPEETI